MHDASGDAGRQKFLQACHCSQPEAPQLEGSDGSQQLEDKSGPPHSVTNFNLETEILSLHSCRASSYPAPTERHGSTGAHPKRQPSSRVRSR